MDFEKMIWIVLAVAGVLLFLSKFRGRISSAAAKRLVGEGARLIDVRTPGEFASGSIKGAKNIPLSDIGQRLKELEPKDKPVVVFCQSGMRSARALGILKKAGFRSVHNLGGIGSWRA